MLCGSGYAGAHDEAVALAGKLKAPILHALRMRADGIAPVEISVQ